MENVLSKKVKRFWAFALAFVLTLTSLPFTQNVVWAAGGWNEDGFTAKITAAPNGDSALDNLYLITGGSATVYSSASTLDNSSALKNPEWSLSNASASVTASTDDNKSSAVVTASTVGTAVLTYTASGSANSDAEGYSSASAQTNVHVLGIGVGGNAATNNTQTSVQYVSRTHGSRVDYSSALVYHFGTGNSANSYTSENNSWSVTAAGEDGSSLTLGANPGSASNDKGSYQLTINEDISGSGSAYVTVENNTDILSDVKAASAIVNFEDVGEDLTVRDEKGNTLTAGDNGIVIPMLVGTETKLDIGLSSGKATNKKVYGSADEGTKTKVTATAIGGDANSSSAVVTLTASAVPETKNITLYASGTVNGSDNVILGDTEIVADVQDAPTFAIGYASAGSTGTGINVIDLHDTTTSAPLETNFGEAKVISGTRADYGVGSAVGSVSSEGLYLVRSTSVWDVKNASSESKVTNAKYWGVDQNSGSTNAYFHVADTSSASAGIYSVSATYDVVSVVRGETGFKVAAVYPGSASASAKVAAITLKSSAGDALAYADGKYSVEVPLRANATDTTNDVTIKLDGLEGEVDGWTSVSSSARNTNDSFVQVVSDQNGEFVLRGLQATESPKDITVMYSNGQNTYSATVSVTVTDKMGSFWFVTDSSSAAVKYAVSSLNMSVGTYQNLFINNSSAGRGGTEPKSKYRLTSSNESVITISSGGTGCEDFTIVANAEGTATITLNVVDITGGEETILATKELAVEAFNDPITLTPPTIFLPVGGETADLNVKSKRNSELNYGTYANDLHPGSAVASITFDSASANAKITSGSGAGKKEITIKLKNSSGAAESSAVATIETFELWGSLNNAADKKLDYKTGSAGVYDQTLSFVKLGDGDPKYDELKLQLRNGTDYVNPGDSRLTIESGTPSVVEVVNGTLVPKKGGTALVTIGYKDTTRGAGADLVMYMNVTVKDYSFTLDTIPSQTLSASQNGYVLTPTVTFTDTTISSESAKAYVQYRFSIKQPSTFDDDKRATDPANGSAKMTTASGSAVISTGSSTTTDTDPYIVSVTARLTSSASAYSVGSLLTSETQEFRFFVKDGSPHIVAPTKSYFFAANGGTQTINLVRQSSASSADNDNGGALVVAKKDNPGTGAKVSISGDNITIEPSSGSAEAFEIYVGDASKGSAGAGNNLSILQVNLVGADDLLDQDTNLYSYNMYLTSDNVKTGKIDIKPNPLKITTGSGNENFSNANYYVTWESDKEDVVTVSRATSATAGALTTGTITAVKEGTAVVTATIKTYPTTTATATGTPVNTIQIPVHVTINDLSDAKLASLDEVILDKGESFTLAPAFEDGKIVNGVEYTFTKKDTSGLLSSPTFTSDSGMASVVVTAHTSAEKAGTGNATITVTAKVGTKTVDTKDYKIKIIDTLSKGIIKAKYANSFASVNDNEIIAATNLAPASSDGMAVKNKDVTLADLTEYGLYTWGTTNWDWKNPATKIATLGLDGDKVYVPVVYTDGDYKKESTVTLDLITVEGLKIKETAESGEWVDALAVNTSGTSKEIYSLALSRGDENVIGTAAVAAAVDTPLQKYLTNYIETFTGLKTKANFVVIPEPKGKSATAALSTTNGTRNGITITTGTTYGKTTITAMILGFETKIEVNNVAKLAGPITINSISGVSGPSAKTGFEGVYYTAWTGTKATATMNVTVENVTKLTVKSDNTAAVSVATSTATSKGGNAFEATLNINSYGKATITLTTDDSVKSSKSFDIYVTYPGAVIGAMQLDPAASYDADTNGNIIDLMMAGCGYQFSDIKLTSQKDSKGGNVSYFSETVNKAGADALTGEQQIRLLTTDKKLAAGTYTLTFDVTVSEILGTGTSVVKDVEMKVNVAEIKFSAGSFSVKQTNTANFFYNYDRYPVDARALFTITCKNADIGSVSLSSPYFEIVKVSDGTLDDPKNNVSKINNPGTTFGVRVKDTITKKSDLLAAITAANRKLTFTITPDGYSTGYQKTVTMKAKVTAPKLVVSVKSGTVYTGVTGMGSSFNTTITSKDNNTSVGTGLAANNFVVGLIKNDKTKAILYNSKSASNPFTVSGNENVITIAATKSAAAGTTKAAITLTDADRTYWQAADYAVEAPVSIKVDNKTSTVKLATDLKTVTLNNGADFRDKEVALLRVYTNGGTDVIRSVAEKFTLTGANSKSAAIVSSLGYTFGKYDDPDNPTAATFKKAAESGVDATDSAEWVLRLTMKQPIAKGSYKLTIANSGVSSKPISFTLKVEEVAPTITLKSSKYIDAMDSDSYIQVKANIKGMSVENALTLVKEGTNATQFASNHVAADGVGSFRLSRNGNAQLSIKQKYSVSFRYQVYSLEDGATPMTEITVAKPLTFKVKNTKLSASAMPTVATGSLGGTRTVKIYGTAGKLGAMYIVDEAGGKYEEVAPAPSAKISLATKTAPMSIEPGVLKNVYTYGASDGAYHRTSNLALLKVTPTSGKPGKTLTVKVNVYMYGQAVDAKPAVATVKVKLPK